MQIGIESNLAAQVDSDLFHNIHNLQVRQCACAEASRALYSCRMARADCPICKEAAGKWSSGLRRARRRWRPADARPALRRANRKWCGRCRAIARRAIEPSGAGERARAGTLPPLRLRKLRNGQRNRKCSARAARGLEPQPGAGQAHGAAVRGGISVPNQANTACC